MLGRVASVGGGALLAHQIVSGADKGTDGKASAPVPMAASAGLSLVGAVLTRKVKPLAWGLVGVGGLTGARAGVGFATGHEPAVKGGSGNPEIDASIQRLSRTRTAGEVATVLASGDVKFAVLDDAEFQARYPGAGGVYLGAPERTIVLPQEAFADPERLDLIMAHEGQHALDDLAGRSDGGTAGTIRGVFSGITRMVQEPGNPVTRVVDGIQGAKKETEVRAYTLQADLAEEMGADASGIGDTPGASQLTGAELREALAHDSLYAAPADERRGVAGKVALAEGALLGAGLLGASFLPGGSMLRSRPVAGVLVTATGGAYAHEMVAGGKVHA